MPTRRSRLAIIAAILVCLVLAACSSPYTRTTLPRSDRSQAFAAARVVLMKRFHGLRELDEAKGILVTDYKQPSDPAPTARFYATVEVAEMGTGADMRVRVIQEGLSFQDLRMVWVDAGRSDGVRAVEGYIIEEIRAHLEDRKADIPRDPDAVAREMDETEAGAAKPAAPQKPE